MYTFQKNYIIELGCIMVQNIEIEINSLSDVSRLGEIHKKAGIMKNEINLSKVARELNCDRRTVKKYYSNNAEKKKRKKRVSKVTIHHTEIKTKLEEGHYDYLIHIYRFLKREYNNLNYSESTFKNYVYNNFSDLLCKQKQKRTVRFETSPGHQVQLDYKENQTYILKDGFKVKVDILCLTFGYSRVTYRKLICDKSTKSTVDALVSIFEEIGYVPHEMVIDNAKSLVTTPKKKDSEAVLNEGFASFAKDFNISIFACAPYRPQTKGKAEVQMKVVDELKLYNGIFEDRVHISEVLDQITNEGNTRLSQAHNQVPKLLFKQEKEHMQSLPRQEICSSYKLNKQLHKVSNESMISFKANKYSLPPIYSKKEVFIHIMNEKLYIYYKGNFLCLHNILQNKINYTENHKVLIEQKAYTAIKNTENKTTNPLLNTTSDIEKQSIINAKSLPNLDHYG